MTHFTILVCADDPDELDNLLAPYDENLETTPRRDYEEGDPQDHWAVKNLREEGWLGSADEPLTWMAVAEAFNARYYSDGDGEKLLLDEEFPGDPRAYTMTTYNPDSKWDWWTIGGRWRGHFRYKPGFAEDVLNADTGPSKSGFGFDPPTISALHCDGGRKRALDLAGTRDEAEHKARESMAKWQAVTAGLEGKPWGHFTAMAGYAESYTIEQARKDYHDQPIVRALQDTDFRWWDDPIARFSRPLEDVVAEARCKAVPGYALVRRDGTWLAPGRMGWFGMSSDDAAGRLAYQDAASAYIDGLPDDAWLIMVDAHI